jgi:hypothetical protein
MCGWGDNLAGMTAMFMRTHVTNLNDQALELVLYRTYGHPRVWVCSKHLMAYDDPEIKDAKLSSAMKARPEGQQVSRTWTDSNSGT